MSYKKFPISDLPITRAVCIHKGKRKPCLIRTKKEKERPYFFSEIEKRIREKDVGESDSSLKKLNKSFSGINPIYGSGKVGAEEDLKESTGKSKEALKKNFRQSKAPSIEDLIEFKTSLEEVIPEMERLLEEALRNNNIFKLPMESKVTNTAKNLLKVTNELLEEMNPEMVVYLVKNILEKDQET